MNLKLKHNQRNKTGYDHHSKVKNFDEKKPKQFLKRIQLSKQDSDQSIKILKLPYIKNSKATVSMQFFNDQQAMKKYSKVSSALKCRLFHCIFIKKLSIKDSAKLCKLNYSTAKSIIKNMTQKQENYVTNELNLFQMTLEHENKSRKRSFKCFYRTVENVEKNRPINTSDQNSVSESEIVHKMQEITSRSMNLKPITIVSTIGFDFFNIQEEHKALSENLNFTNPFESKKSISYVIDLSQIQKNRVSDPQKQQTEVFRIKCARKQESDDSF